MNNDIVPRDESRECIPGLLAPSEWVEPRLIVLDQGRRVSFHIADALRYHGLESVGGVILGFRLAQRALAESLGLRSVPLAALAGVAPAFDTVVNTIPAVVFTEPVLAALRPGSLIVDLASRPGGTDFAAARRLGLTALHALSLPAACAPETAGEFVAQTVCEILREREGSA